MCRTPIILFLLAACFFLINPLAASAAEHSCGTYWIKDHAVPDGVTIPWTRIQADHGNLPRDRAEYSVGDTHTFWTWDLSVMPPGFNETPFTCRAKGDHCYIWVADDQWTVNVTQAQVDTVYTAWEMQTPPESMDPGAGIYSIATGVFGDAPDELDGDPRIHLLYYDLGSFAGYTFDGYFNHFDEMTETEAQSFGQHSNECEILYINANTSNPVDGDYLIGVLAHEFEHLLHWNGDPGETAWVDEGCAQLSWYLCGYGTDGQENYFANHPENDLTDFEISGSYGQVTLFFVYLYEQFGGAAAFRDLVATEQNGFEGLETAFETHRYAFDRYQVFHDWVVACGINDSTLDHGQYGYRDFDPPEFKIREEFQTFPTGSQTGSLSRWSGRYYLFNGMQSGLTLDFSDPDLNCHVSAATGDPGEPALIPMDRAFNQIQCATADQPVLLIFANTDSSNPTASLEFSGEDDTASDTTPPCITSAMPWSGGSPGPFGLITVADQLSGIDPASLELTVNGTAPAMTSVMRVESHTAEIHFSLAGMSVSDSVTVAVTVADDAGNTMSETEHRFIYPGAVPGSLGVTLAMPGMEFHTGDPCFLTARIDNPGESLGELPLFVILDVYSSYYFAPSWSEFDHYSPVVDTGVTFTVALPLFAWPEIEGAVSGLFFYGALTDTGITSLVGQLSQWEFGWAE